MRIKDDNELDLCDAIITIIYPAGEVTEDHKEEWKCERIYHCGEFDEPITLRSIKERYPDRFIMVISDHGLHGEIYSYGNHGDFWEKVGDTQGYA